MSTPAKKMVLIEDEEDLRQIVSSFFRNNGWEVYEFGTLTEGIPALDLLRPNVLFLDNNLPDGEGWEKAPDLARKFPEMLTNLVSGFHPAPPPMPEGARFRILEKPFSFAQFRALL